MKRNQLLEKTLDNTLHYIAPIAEEELMKEFNSRFNGNIEFSKEHEGKIQKLFKTERKKQFSSQATLILKRIAIIFIIISVVSTISILIVEAWRIKYLNFIIEVKDKYSDISLKEVTFYNNSYKTEDIAFGYIPEGFLVEDTKITDNHLFIQFVNQNNLYFSLDVNSLDVNLSIDTENANLREILINDGKAVLVEKNNEKILVWNNDKHIFTLIGNIKTSEIIKIAENIIK